MKMKAAEILAVYESLSKLADKELDLETACVIAKDMKELLVAKEVIEKKRNALVMEYAEKDGDGNIMYKEKETVKINDMDGFMKKMSALLSSEADVGIADIPKNALKEIKVSANDLLPLMDFIK